MRYFTGTFLVSQTPLTEQKKQLWEVLKQAIHIVATAATVTLAKAAAFTGFVMLVKWIYMKIRNADKKDD